MNNILKNNIAYILLLASFSLFLLQLPNFIVMNEHDLGSQAAYEYWLVHGFQYGIDFLQNVGPFGFLNYPLLYSGFLFNVKIFLNIFLVLSFLLLVPKSNFYIFPVIFLSLLLQNKQDVFIYILLHISFIHILQPSPKYKLLLALFIASLLCLSKSTCLFVTFWGVIVLLVKSQLNKEKYIAKVILFLLFLISLWLLAGQSLVGFIYHLNGAVLFSNGYNDAMAVQEPVYVTISATCVVVYYFSLLFRRLTYKSGREKVEFFFDSIFFSFLLFAVWKHGMVRADAGHISIFFAYSIFAIGSQIILINSEHNGKFRQIGVDNSVFPVFLLLASYFLFMASNTSIDKYIYHSFSIMRQNLFFLLNLQEARINLDHQLISFKKNISLSTFKDITQTNKVGYLGIKPAVMLYSNFNYQPNPSTISFASWNKSTILADSVFFAEKVDFLIAELETIDHRFLPLDSSLSKMEILKGFSFVASNGSYLLLKRKGSKTPLTFLTVGTELPYTVGSWKTIPNMGNFTWIKIDLANNLFESLLSIPYKSMSYQIEFNYENSKVKSYRFIPALGREGFLLTPEILNNNDLLNHLEHVSVSKERPIEFRIICSGPSFFCKEKGTVHFLVGL